MSHAAISSLEDLELQPQMISRLKNIGIETISDLAISVPEDLFEHCGISDACTIHLIAGCDYDHT